jgi:hypothetical protein
MLIAKEDNSKKIGGRIALIAAVINGHSDIVSMLKAVWSKIIY